MTRPDAEAFVEALYDMMVLVFRHEGWRPADPDTLGMSPYYKEIKESKSTLTTMLLTPEDEE